MSIEIKKRGNQDYVYDMSRVNGKIQATYLGKVGDPKTDEIVKQFAEDQQKKKKEKDNKKNLLPAPENVEMPEKKKPLFPEDTNEGYGLTWRTRIGVDAPKKHTDHQNAEKFHAPKRDEYRPDEHPVVPVKRKAMFGKKDSQIESIVS
ncbi:MAG: hypothetical protein FIB07_17975 [Candidatus Methanoperedens sp.]|nr:hypothetical protein [Candidatus Methanoperedens sp.]